MSTDILADDYDAAEHWQEIKARAAEQERAEAIAQKIVAPTEAFAQWVFNLPKNVGVGVLDAALNTMDAVADFAGEVKKNFTEPGGVRRELNEQATGDPQGRSPHERRMAGLAQEPPVRNPAREAIVAFRDEMARGSNLGDTITQGIAQFAVPFAGWTKLLGGLKGVSTMTQVGRAAGAEAGSVATAFAPDSGRVADLVVFGQQLEGKLGQTLQEIAPDGSLLNAYIDYMATDEDESALEGRFKNVVDSLVTSAAGAGVIKAGASSIKMARKLPGYLKPAEPVPPPAAEPVPPTRLEFVSPDDAVAARADLERDLGPDGWSRIEAGFEKRTDKNFDTLHSFARVLQTNVERPVSSHSLITALERNLKGDTEQGAFYKELLGRLRDRKLGGQVVVRREIKGADKPNLAGRYTRADNLIQLGPLAFRDPERLLHVFTHEAVHAATFREMRESPTVFRRMERLMKTAQKAIEANPEGEPLSKYGFTNADEFVAEIESNPGFRAAMKKLEAGDGTVWDEYLKTIAGILGLGALALNPEFAKLMDPQEDESA